MAVPPSALDAGPCAILKGKLPIFNALRNGHGFTAELLGQFPVAAARSIRRRSSSPRIDSRWLTHPGTTSRS